MVLRITCNIITLLSSVCCVAFLTARLIIFPKKYNLKIKSGEIAKTENEVFTATGKYKNNAELFSKSDYAKYDENEKLTQKTSFFSRYISIDCLIVLITMIIGIIACCFGGVPYNEDTISGFSVWLTVAVCIAMFISLFVYNKIFIAKYDIPKWEKRNRVTVSHGLTSMVEISFAAALFTAILVSINVNLAVHVIYTWIII